MFVSEGTYVIRSANIEPMETFLMRDMCTLAKMEIGTVIRAMLIKIFMISMQFPHATWTILADEVQDDAREDTSILTRSMQRSLK